MGAVVPIRDDIPAEEWRRLARPESDGRVACRLLGLANVIAGMSRVRGAPGLEIRLVLVPGDAVDARCSFALQLMKREPQQVSVRRETGRW